MQTPALVLFRQDLRLADNPALQAGLAHGPVIPVYVLDDETPDAWRLGGASRWWLHRSLAALSADIAKHGNRLILRRGRQDREVRRLVEQTGAGAVFWNRCYEPFARERDGAMKMALREKGLEARSFNAALLFEPGSVLTRSGGPFSVFTPFWRACLSAPPPQAPLPRPRQLPAPDKFPASDRLEAWRLLPHRPDWAHGLRQSWAPGEAGARRRLAEFVDDALIRYEGERDIPSRPSTSRLSPHLHFGEIGPRQIWHALEAARHDRDAQARAAAKFLSELGWREFSYNLLHDRPDLPRRNLRREFDRFPWRHDAKALTAWQRGRTGYPIVDAGMRELWHTGWMHNRVRMIAASFLIKHLLHDWRQGEEWFWDTLVDADLANNAASWQWIAGSGADAAPYFRIFNPVLQGERFDRDGAYVARWVPELAKLPPEAIHAPWRADAATLARAGVELDRTYPRPIVDHDAARKRALAAFASLKQSAA